MHFANVVKHEYIGGDFEQWIVEFKHNKFGASILYDLRESDFEVAVLENGIVTYDTHLTSDVIPHLTYDEVVAVLEKIRALTPSDINRSMSKQQLRKAMGK